MISMVIPVRDPAEHAETWVHLWFCSTYWYLLIIGQAILLCNLASRL